jgi:hypothetical protein
MPDDNQTDVTNLTTEQIAAQIASQEANPPAEPKTYTINVGDKTQTYRTSEDGQKAHQAAVDAMKQREVENQQLRDQNTALIGGLHQQPTQPQQPTDQAQFEQQQYYSLLSTDPIAAQNYMDKFRFGMSTEELTTKLNNFNQTNEQMQIGLAAQEFHRRVGEQWPATQEASDAVTKRIQELGMDISANSLELAFYQLKNEGSIRAIEQTTETAAETTSRGSNAPPVVTTTDTGELNTNEPDPYHMDMDKLKVLVEKEGPFEQT